MKEVVECLKVVSRSIPLHIWNGLSRRKRKTAVIGQQQKEKAQVTLEEVDNKPYLTLEMKTKPSVQCLNQQLPKPVKSLGRVVSSRSTRVSDEDTNLDSGKEFKKSVSGVRRARSGRILVDLFNEAAETETSGSKSIDWQALANLRSPSVKVPTLTLRQAMLVRGSPTTQVFRSGPLPVFGEKIKEASSEIVVRNPSIGRVRKPRVCIDSTIHYKQIPQVTNIKVVEDAS